MRSDVTTEKRKKNEMKKDRREKSEIEWGERCCCCCCEVNHNLYGRQDKTRQEKDECSIA